MWGIAGRQLGDPYRWPEIASLSTSIVQPGDVRMGDPDLIRPGWTLVLPVEPVDHGPVLVSGMSGAIALAAGENHSCAVLVSGQVTCWGNNESGQLGSITPGTSSATPVLVPGVSGATSVAAAGSHVCAVINGGQVLCWGSNGDWQLGRGTTSSEFNPPMPVSGVSGASAVAAGDLYSCALATGGQVTCWGAIGDQETDELFGATPVLVSGARAVAAGGGRPCAVLDGGKVTCWRGNEVRVAPVLVPGVSRASGVAEGSSHVCAVLNDGQVACWGSNQLGQLGGGTTKASSSAMLVSGVSGATAVATGGYHTCAVVNRGQVACWGWNQDGQLGRGPTGEGTYSATPVLVPGVSGAVAVAAGRSHSCAVIAGGQVTCWGWNGAGQLGAGNSAQP